MDTVQNIINFFIASGILALLVRSIIKLYVDKDIEKFKSELQREVTRFRVQYEKLHLERVEVIKKCYQKIVKVTGQIEYLTHDIEYKDREKSKDKYKELSNEFSKLTKYYQVNALYFDKDVQDIFNALFQWIFQMFNMCNWLQYNRTLVTLKGSKVVEEEITEEHFNERVTHVQVEMNKTLALLKTKLEDKFQDIIGV